MRLLIRFLALTTIAMLIPGEAAWSQAQRSARVSGRIESVNGTLVTVKSPEGEMAVNLLPGTRIYAQVRASLADIRPGSFLGVGAMPQADGSQQAIRVMIFPEAMRGQGEGHRPWDRPGTTMTNATVETAVTGVSGQVLSVKYRDGEQKILIRPESEILTYVDGDRRELRPGLAITASGSVKPGDAGAAMDAERITFTR